MRHGIIEVDDLTIEKTSDGVYINGHKIENDQVHPVKSRMEWAYIGFLVGAFVMWVIWAIFG
jgi:hypothetical protein